MSFSPIAFIAPNYRDYKNEWLKAYEPGTTTPKTMSLDSIGTTLVAKLQLNKDGFIVSAGGALVIPYIDGPYDLWLFPSDVEADNNDTSNALRVADDIINAGAIAPSVIPFAKEENQILIAGQTEVTLSTVSIGFVSVSGDDIDDGDVLPISAGGVGRRYTPNGLLSLTLDRTYPAGTAIKVIGASLIGGSTTYAPSSVWDFGAFDDQTNSVDQTEFFENAALAIGNDGYIIVPPGRYTLLSATTTAALWYLMPNAEIIGEGGVPPTFQTDAKNLTGAMIRYSREAKDTLVYYGETDYALQKARGRGISSTVNGVSQNGQGGVAGGSLTSKSDNLNQGCIGVTAVVINDNSTVDRTAWALYSEAVQETGAGGNTFTHENAIVNKNATIQTHPNQVPGYGDGFTVGEWCSVGIGQIDDTNATAWKTTLSASVTAKYSKGWVVYNGAIQAGADYKETCSWENNSAIAWYPSVASTVNSTPLAWLKGIDLGDGAGSIRFHVTDTNGVGDAEWSVTTSAFGPVGDNVHDIATSSVRVRNIYLQNAPDVVSDGTKKTDVTDIDINEKAAAAEIKSKIKKFRWTQEKDKKGEAAYWHVSPIAQDVWSALEDNDLDPTRYGFVSRDEDGNNYSIIQTELILFIMAAEV